MTSTSILQNNSSPSLALALRGPTLLAWGLMAGLAVGVGGWAANASLSGAVMAQGSFVVDRNVKKVQHPFGGIVAEILVRNGDRVEAGQTLVRLDATQLKSELGVIQSQIIELTARSARLQSERDGRSTIKFPPGFEASSADAKDAADSETRLLSEALKFRESQKKQLQHKSEQSKEEIAGLSSQLEAKRSELAVVEKEARDIRQLHGKQLVTQNRVNNLERELSRLTGDRGNITAQIARVTGQIHELEVQILAIDESARAQAQKELRATEARLVELTERAVAASDKLSKIEIRSPQAGAVHETIVHTVGGVVGAAEQLMIVVPQDDALSITAKIAPIDIDQVVVGRAARLRLSAFSQQTTPELEGRVVHVSADITTDQKTGQGFYSVKLEIDESSRVMASSLKLLPGMPAEVFITTGERTALSYLLKPFADQVRRAFREPR